MWTRRPRDFSRDEYVLKREGHNKQHKTQSTLIILGNTDRVSTMMMIHSLLLASLALTSAFTTHRNAFVGRAVTSRYVCGEEKKKNSVFVALSSSVTLIHCIALFSSIVRFRKAAVRWK
jgi:hypothetical protein